MIQEIYAHVNGIDLTRREFETLKFVRHYLQSRPRNLRTPPSQRELFDFLNSVLSGRERLVSTQQTQRVVDSLRVKGLVVDPETLPEEWAPPSRARNIALTLQGERVADQILVWAG